MRRVGAIAAGLVAVSLAAAGCAEDSAGPESGQVEVADLTEGGRDTTDPDFDEDEFVGQEVTVSGEITERLGDQAFVLAGDGTAGGGLPVFSAAGADVEVGDVVEVTGIVRVIDTETFEQDFGFELDEGLFGGFDQRKAIDASSVERVS